MRMLEILRKMLHQRIQENSDRRQDRLIVIIPYFDYNDPATESMYLRECIKSTADAMKSVYRDDGWKIIIASNGNESSMMKALEISNEAEEYGMRIETIHYETSSKPDAVNSAFLNLMKAKDSGNFIIVVLDHDTKPNQRVMEEIRNSGRFSKAMLRPRSIEYRNGDEHRPNFLEKTVSYAYCIANNAFGKLASAVNIPSGAGALMAIPSDLAKTLVERYGGIYPEGTGNYLNDVALQRIAIENGADMYLLPPVETSMYRNNRREHLARRQAKDAIMGALMVLKKMHARGGI